MTAREQKRAARRVDRARELLLKMTPVERAQLLREVGTCTCAAAARAIAKSPLAAIGAVVGGVIGALLTPDKADDKPHLPKMGRIT